MLIGCFFESLVTLFLDGSHQHKDILEHKTQSVHSHSDVNSESRSSILARKRAKAEAAKVTLEFAIKEAQLRKEQACALEKHLLEEATAKAAAARKKAEIDAELEILTQAKSSKKLTPDPNVIKLLSILKQIFNSNI